MAEQQRERDIAEMEAQMAHDTDQYFEARPQIMRTRDKETTFEAGFKAAWAARPLSHAEGEAVDHWAVRNPGLADQFRAEAQTVRKRLGFEPDADDVSPNDLRERIAEIEGAPQVAVPEGYALVPEDMLTHFRDFHDAVKTLSKTADPDGYWEHQCEVCKRIESQLAAAPTAPAGEPEPDVADIELDHVMEWAEAVGCVEVEPRHDDAEFLVARAILDARRQQPVSDPDGFEQVLEELRKLHTEMTNTDLVHEGSPEIVGYCVTGKQLDRMEWLLTCCASAGLNSAPAPDEREMAAKALDDFMFDVAERVRLLSDSDLEARVLRKVNGWLHSRAARLRAGKEGE